MDLVGLFFTSAVVQNLFLVFMLGVPQIAWYSRNTPSGYAVGAVIAAAALTGVLINWPLYHYLLVPLGCESYLYLAAIVTIAAVVQLGEKVVDHFFPLFHPGYGRNFPKLVMNCAVYGVSLFIISRGYGFWQSIVFAVGSMAGWLAVIFLVASMNDHLRVWGRVPAMMKGPGIIAAISAILSMALMGFKGMV